LGSTSGLRLRAVSVAYLIRCPVTADWQSEIADTIRRIEQQLQLV
jgi:hypothetical protein